MVRPYGTYKDGFENSREIQPIHSKDRLTLTSLFKPGSTGVTPDTSLTVDKPSLAVFPDTELLMSDPTLNGFNVNVNWDDSLQTITLPKKGEVARTSIEDKANDE